MYKVLLVDDEPLILEGMKLVINWEELGLEVAGAAQNGAQALEFIDFNPIDILITDIRMPVMDGLKLLAAVKAKHAGVKAIILSGHDDFEYVKEAARYGIENYLLKPVNDEELLSTLLLVIRKLDNEAVTVQRQRQDSTIIRDNILLRWVTNSISHTELETRADLLDLMATEACYTAAVIHLAGRAEADGRQYPERYQAAVTAVCERRLGGRAYVFKNLEGDIVALHHAPDGAAAGELSAVLHQMLPEIARETGAGVFILTGSAQRGFENAHVSYADAMKLMDYTLILSGSHVVEFGRSQQDMSRLENEPPIDFTEIRRLILEKDLAGTGAFIDGVYSRLAANDHLTPAMLRNTTMRMGLFILNTVSQAKNLSKGFMDGSDAVYADIWERKSPQELEGWVKGIAAEAVSFLMSADRNYSPVVRKVVQYIDANYDKEIALKCIADLLNMNAVYLGQLFKNETGWMFTSYLNSKRVDEAKKLLLATKMNVVDIGVKVGYSNNNHFFSVFKKIVNVSPTEYRRMNSSL